jgi:hypothetical protein
MPAEEVHFDTMAFFFGFFMHIFYKNWPSLKEFKVLIDYGSQNNLPLLQ